MELSEKALLGLSCCLPETEEDAALGCGKCPYCENCGDADQDVMIRVQIIEDVRNLLKKQQPRILAPDEFGECGIGWIEYWFGEKHPKVYFEQCVWAGSRVMTYNLMFSLEPRSVKYKYGKLCGFRIWAGDFAPSEEMRKGASWDG